MKVSVQKWGNSLAIRLPKAIAVESELGVGSVVDLALENGKVVLTPVSPPKYTLDQLVGGITKRNRHAEVDTGGRRGEESW